MTLTIIGSSSSGNGYLLESRDGSQLAIEAGRPLAEFRKVGGMRLRDLKAMLISHKHGDHASRAEEFLHSGAKVFSNAPFAIETPGIQGLIDGQTYDFGGFHVTPFRVEHDVPCYGYLIHHKEMGVLFFATDCYNLHQIIRGVNHYLIEANYDDGILKECIKAGRVSKAQADRVRLSHMSLEHCVEYLKECDASSTADEIVLIHPSGRHLNAIAARDRVMETFGVPTYTATKGTKIELVEHGNI